MKLALCGNPNVGKTTLFNRLTCSDAPVGNWHGVTVEARHKKLTADGSVTLTDLPGTYSLTARSAEEEVTRDEVLFGQYDVIVCVAEINALRRNLYLLAQLFEAQKKCVLVINMMDEARRHVDLAAISRGLGIPVVGTSEKYADPSEDILRAARTALYSPLPTADYISAARSRSGHLAKAAERAGIPAAYAALKCEEGDKYILGLVGENGCDRCECGRCSVDGPAISRYAFIDGALRGGLSGGYAYSRTDKIDRVLAGKAALPMFFLIMAAVFVITFEAAKPLTALIGKGIANAAASARAINAPEWVRSLLADGIISGVGAVLSFLPQVTMLFLLTALLGDIGYMSRVAFVTDGFFKKFGLSGRAAFSVILGLGCSVTAVLSTRGMSDSISRRRAAFISPFVPCSARLAVFTAFTAYLGMNGLMTAGLYALGCMSALAVLWIAKKSGGGGEGEKLIMEMPPYRLPSARRVLRSVLSSVLSFAGRVGTAVLGVSVIMWTLSSFSVGYGFTGGADTSIMCTFASMIAPVFSPLGFGNWRAVTALISGVAAKETVISVITALGGPQALFATKLEAVSFLVFTCLYVPCAATLAALAKENGARSALLSIAVHTVIAYSAAFIVYRSALWWMSDKRLLFVFWACIILASGIAAVLLRFCSKSRKTKKRRRRDSVDNGEKVQAYRR